VTTSLGLPAIVVMVDRTVEIGGGEPRETLR